MQTKAYGVRWLAPGLMAKWPSKIESQVLLIPKLRARLFAWFCIDSAYVTSVTIVAEGVLAALCPGRSLGLLAAGW